MQYLSNEFPIINLPSPIIQMRLELVPDEFCSCNRQSFISKNLNKNTQNNNIIENFDEIGKSSFKINENNLIKEKEEENICKREEIDELEILAEEIRSGIKRLELLEEETNLINRKEMRNLQGINEINKSVKQQKNIRPKHQLNPNKKLPKINKNKRQSITQSDLEKKQKTYSAFLSFLLKQKGIEGGEELTTTTEPLKSSSEINNNNYYSTNNSVCSSESRSSLTSNKERRKNKKINYSSKLNEEEESSTSNWASEEEENEEKEENIFEKELTKEQLLQEMNKVGKHLEWIWAQIGGRINEENVDGEDYDNEEVEEGEDNRKEEELLERKENIYVQELLENEEQIQENKEGKEEALQQEPNEQKFSSEEEFPYNNIEIKQFKMPEIRIKSNVDFSIPSLIEEEKSYELRELEEIEEIELNCRKNILFYY
uniref:Uncharacterized protein n=1 Tax=Meloidogyne incognita TaxID=6306 RepID=A0A914MTI9_MELIC